MGWLLRPDRRLASAAQDAQGAFAELDWITPIPTHFLHTWIGSVVFGAHVPTRDEIDLVVERARSAWAGTDSFDVVYRRVNCFHSAIVVEVDDRGPRALITRLVESGYWQELPIEGAMRGVAIETFLPHMTIGVVNRPSEPTPLRGALVPLREADFGRQRIEDATLCLMPASRAAILDPWEVVGSVPFG